MAADRKRPIFRAKALQHYMESRQQAVLPRLISAPTVAVLWILIILIGIAGYVAWSTPTPVYRAGIATIVSNSNRTPGVRGELAALVFLPADAQQELKPGQSVTLTLNLSGNRLDGTVVAVEPEILGPTQVTERYRLSPAAAQVVSGPASVAIVQIDPAAKIAPGFAGSVASAQLATGERRVASYLPIVGRLLD